MNCKILIRDYLMEKHMFYRYRYYVALLVTLLVVNLLVYGYDLKYLSILSVYLVSFLVFFIVVGMFNMICINCISNEEYDAMVRNCQKCMKRS